LKYSNDLVVPVRELFGFNFSSNQLNSSDNAVIIVAIIRFLPLFRDGQEKLMVMADLKSNTSTARETEKLCSNVEKELVA